MSEQDPREIGAPASTPAAEPWEIVDATTRARIGSLCAHGCTDAQVVDILLLTIEQVKVSKLSPEYKTAYSEIAEKAVQRQIDLEEGWDTVEEMALTTIVQTLQYNRDPKFALAAAATANRAERRKKQKDVAPVIDASKAGGQSNITMLVLNKNYIVNQQAAGDSAKILDLKAKNRELPERRIVDLPSPQQVEELLAPVKNAAKAEITTEIEQLMRNAGVSMDINEK